MVILVCGGVGSGKSLVLDFLKSRYNATVFGMDEMAHALYQKGEIGYREALCVLGEGVCAPDGELDRNKMAEVLYRDSSLLDELNRRIHPLVYAEVKKKIKENGENLLVIETALPSGDKTLYNEVWYVHASREVRTERLKKNRAYHPERIQKIMSRQMTEEAFRNYADRIILNEGTREDLFLQTEIVAEAAGLKKYEAEHGLRGL